MIFKKDSLGLGLILGFIGPFLGLIVVYYFRFSAIPFKEFLDTFINENRLITSVGAMSMLANVILFTIYVNTHRDETAKGIFIISMLYGIGLLLLKLLN
jgi:hypothetical protein